MSYFLSHKKVEPIATKAFKKGWKLHVYTVRVGLHMPYTSTTIKLSILNIPQL